MSEERLQKILAQTGFGSRRANEELIRAGRVKVNGQVAILGTKADPEVDRIEVDGKALKAREKPLYIALNKPRGVLSDEDPKDDRPTVRNLVPVSGHLFSVGRLDLDSEGLILLTNDGDLAHHLTHPRYEHEKEYQVQVVAQPDEEQLEIWKRGVVLEDGERTAPADVTVLSNTGNGVWLKVIMHEGKKRQIREVGKRIGLPVKRIIRIRIGTLLLGNLKPGEWRNLKAQEVAALKTLASQERPGRPKFRRFQGPKRISNRSPKPRSKGAGKSPKKPQN